MSGPSSGALDTATKLLEKVKTEIGPHAYDTLHASMATALQEKFDLGHKSAGGAQIGDKPSMVGWLEVAIDQAEIDALGDLVDIALDSLIEPKAADALMRFAEKIVLHRSFTK